MKYKVGDKVKIVSNTETNHGFEIGEIVLLTVVDSDGLPEKCHKLDMSDWWYVGAGEVGQIDSEPLPNYRALYEQEKALHEALIGYVAALDIPTNHKPYEIDAWRNYQQLKQQYGQDTGTAH